MAYYRFDDEPSPGEQVLVMPTKRTGRRIAGGQPTSYRLVPPAIDPTKFIGSLNTRGEFHVKMLKVFDDPTSNKRYWKIETRDHKIGIIPEQAITYASMVEIVEVNDCFLMNATVQRQSATDAGEVQTLFRDVEITRNFGTPTKAK